MEKVLLAEITKREVQSRQVLSQVEGVKEQLRVALSTLQEAISGLHMQTTKNKEMLMKEVNYANTYSEKCLILCSVK